MKLLGKEYKRIKRRITMVRNRTTKKLIQKDYDIIEHQTEELIHAVKGLVSYHNTLGDENKSILRMELDKVLISIGMKNVDTESIETQADALINYIKDLDKTDVVEHKALEPNWEVLGKLFYTAEELEQEKKEYYKKRKKS